jgi:nitroimidazol reductase NimA-like FMN-containing flavoprotein (pyridoxamine 5'-phosphate oxidase superfamily)
MFRELLRKNKQISHKECVELLTNEKRGILSVAGDDGYPYGMPMNHYYSANDGCVYFHCGKKGHRLDALRRSDKVSFCVTENGTKEGDSWALTVRSVIVFGRIEIIDNIDDIIEITTSLSHKFTQDETYIAHEIEHFSNVTLLLKLTPEHICGKKIVES